ncbi:multidrug effflux MFS transporter (plasmid) [Rhizobium sp. WSM1274]|uniref:multidrug effflux MFS transporter n=1 Tax=Rhizobium sp. WSM1274 TaxID=3138254 RepID=UPI0021A3F02B|nr:multidrug effflux MFS transporter [Rhizobium leguminosarum]UWU31735.1 multidrug effflux MFS transporter [Rhizobium leguminosarum bv. viciae]
MRREIDVATVKPHPASTASQIWLMAVLGTLLAFASISTDLYLPAMPGMATALQTSQGSLQYTVSAYLIGFSVGQLIWGPVGDRFGRRIPVAVGLVFFMAGCAGCALSTDVVQLIAFRVLQAVGACAGVVLARAMVRDLYGRDRSASVLSTLMTVMAVAPLLGPSVGGLILRVAPWQAIFWTLVGIGLVTLVALFTVPETLPAERRNDESLGAAFAAYGGLILNARLLAYAGALGFYYAGVFAGISSSSFAYIDYHHLSPQLFGAVFAVGTVGLMATNFANARLVARYGSDRMLKLGAAGAAVSGLVLAFVTATDFGGVYGMAASLWLFTAMNGLVTANAISGALADFPTRAGAVSALMGAIQYGSGVVGSAVAGTFANGTPWPMGVVVAIGGLGSLACASLMRRQSLVY